MKLHQIFTLAALPFILLSCAGEQKKKQVEGNYYTPTYAKGFTIDTIQGVKKITVYNPFQNVDDVKYTYSIDEKPLQRVICMSTTHIAFLDCIEKTEAIVGVSGAQYVYNPSVRKAYEQGKVKDIGYSSHLDYEKILSLKPDVLFAYGVSGEFEAIANKLKELGVKVIYIGEYTEEHPLGKAEWMIAFANFFHLEKQALEKFNSIALEYEQLKKMAATVPDTIPVLLNAPWNETWYVPGKQGNMANYIHDAGGYSIIPLRDNRDSYPLSIESAYRDAQGAAIWLNPGIFQNLDELKNTSKFIEIIPVFREKKVFNNNARSTNSGGSDFFESGTVNPHIVLKDLIKILHPEQLPEHQLYYYHQLR